MSSDPSEMIGALRRNVIVQLGLDQIHGGTCQSGIDTVQGDNMYLKQRD